jgi:hypothetical protein
LLTGVFFPLNRLAEEPVVGGGPNEGFDLVVMDLLVSASRPDEPPAPVIPDRDHPVVVPSLLDDERRRDDRRVLGDVFGGVG